jgi:hypothetical protein
MDGYLLTNLVSFRFVSFRLGKFILIREEKSVSLDIYQNKA